LTKRLPREGRAAAVSTRFRLLSIPAAGHWPNRTWSPSKAASRKRQGEFLSRGISTRTFKRQFSLADYVQVKSAAFDNGLLKIELLREIP
jgi:hypothetical protein